MGRAKKFIPGYVYKKWVIVAEGEPVGKNRTVVCKCLACGAVETIRADMISGGKAKNCNCKLQVATTLAKHLGVACEYRTSKCIKSADGYCCYFCPSKRDCEDACLNKPTECGSFYLWDPAKIKRDRTREEPKQRSLLHYRKEG